VSEGKACAVADDGAASDTKTAETSGIERRRDPLDRFIAWSFIANGEEAKDATDLRAKAFSARVQCTATPTAENKRQHSFFFSLSLYEVKRKIRVRLSEFLFGEKARRRSEGEEPRRLNTFVPHTRAPLGSTGSYSFLTPFPNLGDVLDRSPEKAANGHFVSRLRRGREKRRYHLFPLIFAESPLTPETAPPRKTIAPPSGFAGRRRGFSARDE